MAGFMGTAALKQVDIGFGFADPANPLNSLRLVYREGGLEIPAEELGLGVQSALVVGIFDALRRLGGPVGTLIIEEPEMYLHPQAQRYFYRLLCEMADNSECQVIFSTHSPIFADIARFESIRLFRKEPGEMSRVSLVASQEDETYLKVQHEAQKLVTFDSTRSELLFARRALLLEGQSDRLAILLTAKLMGHDPDAEDMAIVSCGSISNIPFFARVCKALEVPFVILHDSDVYPVTGEAEEQRRIAAENEKAAQRNAAIADAASDPTCLYLLSPSLESTLGIGRRAADKPRRVVEALAKRALAEFPQPLVDAVRVLFDEPSTQNA